MGIDISKYFPNVYNDITEIKELIKIENEEFNTALDEIQNCSNN